MLFLFYAYFKIHREAMRQLASIIHQSSNYAICNVSHMIVFLCPAYLPDKQRGNNERISCVSIIMFERNFLSQIPFKANFPAYLEDIWHEVVSIATLFTRNHALILSLVYKYVHFSACPAACIQSLSQTIILGQKWVVQSKTSLQMQYKWRTN